MLRTRTVIALLMGMIALQIQGAGQGGLTLISSTTDGCEFLFEPENFRMTPIDLDGTPYVRVDFEEASLEGDPGAPQIPVRVVVIGLPPEGGADIRVLTAPPVPHTDARILPSPDVRRYEGMPVQVYEEGEAYRSAELLPGKSWATDAPEIWGSQRILRIRLYPVQFDPASNRILRSPRMSVRIRFDQGGRAGTPRPPAANEALYRTSVLNYETARAWRLPPASGLEKTAWTFGPGPWYKIPVTQEGLYKVTGAFLKDRDIRIGDIDPRTIKLFNNGGRMLPRPIDSERPEALIETPILLSGGEDGSFDEGDYFLFYGKGVTGWEFLSPEDDFFHYGNIYTDHNVYWLTFNDGVDGKRIETETSPESSDATLRTVFWDRLFHEQDLYNPNDGGIHWLGQVFNRDIQSRSFDVSLTDLAHTDSVRFRIQVWSTDAGANRYTVQWNDRDIANFTFGQRYHRGETPVIHAARTDRNTLTLAYNHTNRLAESYLDWYEVHYLRKLRLENQRLPFTSPRRPGLYRYRIEGLPDDGLILDISDPSRIRRMAFSAAGGDKEFTASVSGSPAVYYAVTPDGFMTPSSLESQTLPDLRNPRNGADLVIIAHADFYEQARRLKAHRESFSGLSVVLVDIRHVFDEFGWGLYDPVAIRDFIAWAWANWSVRPAYLLLFGAGDYDYRNILGKTDKNWIPPFQEDGFGIAGARATDDWYVMVAGGDRLPDLAVGRISVRSSDEARIVADKIIRYDAAPDRGVWRNLITLVSDDEVTPRSTAEWFHMEATLRLADSVIPADYNIKPIYLTDYPAEIVFDRRRKPRAQEDLVSQINRGTAFVNFVGHANEEVWTDERIFVRSEDLHRLENGERLPVFYAATCSFGWYDNYQKSSFGEDLVTAEGGGAVAVIAASRDCQANYNEILNRRFMQRAFPSEGPVPRLGDALLGAKIESRHGANDEMYHILGDPALIPATPRYRGVFTEVSPDSFIALHVQTASGHIGKDGAGWSGFQGSIALQAFDSRREVTYTMANGLQKQYTLPGNTIFRGEARVEDGRFTSAFIVPKDITYGSAQGRLSGYLYNPDSDGSVFMDGIPMGGGGEITDTRGPDITLIFEGHEMFVSGGLVDANPRLVAVIADDKTGINITGDIGHKIMLTINESPPVDLTEYFQYDEGSYLKGRLTYPLTGLAPGRHSLTLKAWDNANNSATRHIEFEIVPPGEIRIEEVLSYPNPMQDQTHFTFQINRDAEIDIKIFTVSGRQIRHLSRLWGQPGFNMIPWDGRDEAGDAIANGVYLYKITARTHEGGKTISRSEIGRLIVMHR
ncbi:MAG TPA: type IX secretion system sortase PorU [bacterium]|nr:type IX secretion system sortase PorU [bacterium]